MSSNALVWAASVAPVADVQEYAVLVRMADTVDEYGNGCLLSTKSLARDLKISEKTVQRRLDAMHQRKLIGLGDQRKALYIRADRRPTVWDLLIPAECFASLERTNQRRADLGLEPLTAENRPVQGPPPADAGRAPRSDIGKSRTRFVDDEQAQHGTGGGAEEQPPDHPKPDGVTGSPPVDGVTASPPVRHGVTTSPARGDYQSPDPGSRTLGSKTKSSKTSRFAGADRSPKVGYLPGQAANTSERIFFTLEDQEEALALVDPDNKNFFPQDLTAAERALVDECLSITAERWSASTLRKVIGTPLLRSITAQNPDLVRNAFLIAARDPGTTSPRRLLSMDKCPHWQLAATDLARAAQQMPPAARPAPPQRTGVSGAETDSARPWPAEAADWFAASGFRFGQQSTDAVAS
jgi:hypothetical protein